MGEPVPGDTLDQYQLADIIARGGMATVFLARDLENGHTVALKVPYLSYASDIVFHERFKREEEIGQRLDHPAIIKVLRPRAKSRLYLAMEFVEGELLRERLAREKRLPVATAVDIALRIADALVYMHAQGVVHRDLKPENIMLLPGGGVKLMDFGIALDTTLRKMTWAGLSQTVGTPDYMAPEQIKGRRGDARTDVYALGVILYEMLTGKVPFPADNVYASMRAKMREHPPRPRKLRPEIPAGVEEIVLDAMEPEPANRPENAFALREMLAHPESVVPKERHPPQGVVPLLPPGIRAVLVILGALSAYGVLFWVLSHAG